MYVCLADSSLKLKTAFIFLQEIKKRFKEKYTAQEIGSANAYDMSATFTDIYKQQFVSFLVIQTFFNNSKDQDKK